MRITSPSLLRFLRYLTAPARRSLQLIETEVFEYLHRLVSTNAARAESDFEDRVLGSRRRFEVGIRSRLKEANASAERALERAKERRGSRAARARSDRPAHVVRTPRRRTSLVASPSTRAQACASRVREHATPSSYTILPIATPARQAASPTAGLPNM